MMKHDTQRSACKLYIRRDCCIHFLFAWFSLLTNVLAMMCLNLVLSREVGLECDGETVIPANNHTQNQLGV